MEPPIGRQTSPLDLHKTSFSVLAKLSESTGLDVPTNYEEPEADLDHPPGKVVDPTA